MHCAHCAYYVVDSSVRSKSSKNICNLHNCRKHYYQTCPNFIWNAKYLSINNEKDTYDSQGHLLCRRCGKPLTDSESIARKFGEVCYNRRLYQLQKRAKRLF